MHENPYFAATAVCCHLLLGIVVFLTNSRRPINRSFLVMTIVVAGWVSGVEMVFFSRTAGQVAFWMRFCSAWGVLAPATFILMRNAILYPEEPWTSHIRRTSWWILSGVVLAVCCLSPLYLRAVEFVPKPGAVDQLVPKPIFSPGVIICYLGITISMVGIVYTVIRDQIRPQTTGVHRVELQFFCLAAVTMVINVGLGYGIQAFFHGVHLTRYVALLRVIVFDIIIAYGITSRGILQIRAVMRLGLSYLLLALYSGLLFTAALLTFRWLSARLGMESETPATVAAGVVAAVLLNSASTPLRRVARRILPPTDLDMEQIVSRVGHLLQSVSTLSELLDEFSSIIGQAVGAREVRVLLPGMHGFTDHHAQAELGFTNGQRPTGRLCLDENDPIVTSLRNGTPDLALEELVRHASTSQQRALLGRLRALEADLIVPAHYRGQLSAIVLFSARNGGRIYGGDGRTTLRLISEQLGVAIVNAHLYTEAQRSQAYNRLLVEHLPCGVITLDREGTVHVLNPEARRLLQVDESLAPDEAELPSELTDLINAQRRSQQDPVGEEIVLRPGARDQAFLRAYCLPFTGEVGELLGSVLVLNDHTTLERLQRQVRQADRLASIGTLASGMAHEIKNPLTALKTFTQLLPKRYDDAEFRNDFSGLAGSEIARIERIVNQLLAFARPAPLMIEQVNLHEVIDNAMRLVGPQAARQNVSIRKEFRAGQDIIAADRDRLQQVLLNLLLNALQASGERGWIELSTELEPVSVDDDPFIRLDVRDAGSGIPQDMLPHIFDPFFTTKSEGTGLGLSVSYNIVTEHKGRMEVQSETGKGTCFSIYLPVH